MSAAKPIMETKFQFRPETAENGDEYVIWAAHAAARVKGQHPLVCAAAKDETSARMEHNVWRSAYEKNGDTREGAQALWSLKFGQVTA